MLLQVLDDGRLTDNKGQLVNFKNTIIIMTSNIGSTLIRDTFENMTIANEEEIVERTKKQVFELLKQTIRPEFLNRIDELVMFAPLHISQIEEIVRMQILGVQKVLKENGILLEMKEKAIRFIADLSFDPHFGARPIKRNIQKYLLNDLSKQLIAGKVHKYLPLYNVQFTISQKQHIQHITQIVIRHYNILIT